MTVRTVFVFLLSCFVLISLPHRAATAGLLECKLQWGWDDCSKDEDCTLVDTPCGWPSDPVNKRFAKKLRACNEDEGAAVSCMKWDPAKNPHYRAVCADGDCRAVKIR